MFKLGDNEGQALRQNSGQVMLITVLALSGALLGATTISGLLMLYQIRQTADVVNSTKAIFAADAGLEWRLYKFFKTDSQTCKDCPDGGQCPQPTFANNASFQSTCQEQIFGAEQNITLRSVGKAFKNSRALELVFTRSLPAP